MLDSGTFTELATHGRYREEPEAYTAAVDRWATNGRLICAVTQDYMCEPFMLAKIGLTIPEHQQFTIERYDRIRAVVAPHLHVLPVLQGYEPKEYVAHIRQHGGRLAFGMWVGVGSVCKRNGKPESVEAVFRAVKTARPDLRLHGFGLNLATLKSQYVRDALWRADSLA